MQKINTIFFIAALLIVGCHKYDENIKYNGNNLGELEKAIYHFKQEGNKEKLEAAYFLINNLEGNFSPSSEVVKKYEPFFDLLDSCNKNGIIIRKKDSNKPIDIVKNKWDSLQKYIGPSNDMNYKKDIEYITSEYIIRNVDLAYGSWKKNPWCKHCSFNDFCEYILPYKVLDEPFEEWREYFIKKYSWLKDSLKNKSDPVEACGRINKDVSSWFKFNDLFYKVPQLGFSRLIKGKSGVCPHMVTITAYAARALGIPVAVDFIPNYGNRRSKHIWLSVLDTNKNFIPFNAAGAEWLPFGSINCINTWRNKMTKVFRKTYAINKKCLWKMAKNKEEVPPILRDNKYINVTDQYIPVSDISIKLRRQPPDSCHYAYLCVFNNSEWIPVHWSEIKDKALLFTKMGRDIAYLPIYYKNGKLIQADNPFILAKDGSLFRIEKYKGIVQSIKLFSKYPWYITQRNDTTNKILKGDKYELYYWENGWNSLGITTAEERYSIIEKFGFDFHINEFLEGTKEREFLVYKDVPVGVLFWLRDITRGKDERIFTINEDGEQVWW